MQDQHVPRIGPTYWVTFIVASIFGVNLSDMLALHLALGTAGRVLLFAGALFAILLAERYDRSATHVWYWSAIVVIQAAANKLADVSTRDLGLGRLEVLASLAVLLVVTFVTARSSASMLVETRMIARADEARPMSDTAYWIAMIFASTIGAVGGDLCRLGLGFVVSMVILSVLFGATVWTSRQPQTNRLIAYWLSVVVVRALGTVTADFLASEAQLPAGLAASTLLSGTLMVATLLLWGGDRDARSRS
jgi:uncharacterized membrane-anchored protein